MGAGLTVELSEAVHRYTGRPRHKLQQTDSLFCIHQQHRLKYHQQIQINSFCKLCYNTAVTVISPWLRGFRYYVQQQQHLIMVKITYVHHKYRAAQL